MADDSGMTDSPGEPVRPGLTVLQVEGRVPYREALDWQRGVARRRIDGELRKDLLVLLEHEPVLTLGRGHREEHVVATPERLARAGIPVIEVERGGDVTYHGPGQLVGYPILDLRGYRKDLHWYLRRLEEAVAGAVRALGCRAFRVEEHTGVWVGDGDAPDGDAPDTGGALPAARARSLIARGRVRKVASIGVHVSRWVTWHGFSLNVTGEPLQAFDLIVPCGIPGVHMTSLAEEGVTTTPDQVRAVMTEAFVASFAVETVRRSRTDWTRLRESPVRALDEAVPTGSRGDAAAAARP